MPAYFMAMDIEGRLFVATHDKYGQTWERAPLTPGGMTQNEPIDALVRPVKVPGWAVDSYVMYPHDVRALNELASV